MDVLPILYRDEHLVAVHKPSGLLVHRTAIASVERTFALQQLREQLGRRVYPVHRLDKATSGVLLFALDAETGRRLGAQFERQQVIKTYVAVVRGHPPPAGIIDHPLPAVIDDADREPPRAPFSDARTAYRRLAAVELPVCVDRYPTSRYALLLLHPLTGRRHQIRRHLHHVSHPIVGDTTYGSGRHNRFFRATYDCHRLLLACVALQLTHPATLQPLVLHAQPDGVFAEVIARLGWSAALAAGASQMPASM
jgi:tRNA pseudouridine65 synthase